MHDSTKQNVPNVNVPEKIIFCIDVCFYDLLSLYKLADGTTYTPINMVKKILDFFLHLKSTINKETEFALLVLKGDSAHWYHDFTTNIKELMHTIDYINIEECSQETFDFTKVFNILKEKVVIPEFKENSLLPPPYVVRMIVIYGRCNCLPDIPSQDAYFKTLKKVMYFYTDIIFAHEEDCELFKCEEIYDALQNLDNGYSYVFEVSRNATKIHDCIAKLLAHPLQRVLQKYANYSFGCT